MVLVTASPVFPSRQNFLKALLAAHPEITTIVQNVNNAAPVYCWVTGNRPYTGPASSGIPCAV